MDYILNRLTDIGLRRLYKFVLKRTIGKYLEDELLIDQLNVISRDGIVKLRDIRFNANVLNEEFLSLLPIKIVSLTVSELEVHLSYKTLLTDSCRFVVDQVDIVIAPNENYVKLKSTSPNSKNANAKTEDIDDDDEYESPQIPSAGHTSEEGQKGLSFIANCIEVVVARLQVQVRNINITFKVPKAPATTATATDSKHTKKRTSKHAHSNTNISTGAAANANSNVNNANASNLNRSKMPAIVTHDIVLTLQNIHYFNDDPKAYNTASGEASAVALSMKLTSGNDNASATALQLGARKVRGTLLNIILNFCIYFSFYAEISI